MDYKITEDWGVGYKAEITITNNKDTAIEDWRLSFDYGDNLITQIWNAVVVDNTNGRYELSCETYNQNIEPGASVSFGFMVEPGCSGNFIENISLREYVANESIDAGKEEYAIICGFVQPDTNILSLSMLATVECQRYDIYAIKDNSQVQLMGTADKEGCFDYSLEDDFVSMEIYAMGYGVNGEVMETNHIFVENTGGVCVVNYPDTDDDGVEDYYELYYGSDITLDDTDGDELSDYYEIFVSSTSPRLTDTDKNGINDGDEDYDNDGLSLLEESQLGTDPFADDGDYDGLTDGDEVNVYGTDVFVDDTDGDELKDGDEIELSLDPFITDTDGDGIIDGKERFQQTYTYLVENQNCIVEEISISLEGTGNIKSNTTVESIMNEDLLCSGVIGLVGEPFDIVTESDFERAELTFKVDVDKLGDVPFENLMFLWYDEENNKFVELETKLDKSEGTATIDTTHFSKYMLVDREAWYEAWAQDLAYEGTELDEASCYTTFIIDCSDVMTEYDPIKYKQNITSAYDSRYRKTCYRIEAVTDYIVNMSESEYVSIWTVDKKDGSAITYTNDKESLLDQLQKLYEGEGFAYLDVLDACHLIMKNMKVLDSESTKRVVVITAGEGEEDLSAVQEKFVNSGVSVDLILVGAETDAPGLIALSEATGGCVHRIDKIEYLEGLVGEAYLDERLDLTDGDGDGLYDIMEKYGIRLADGQVINTDPELPDSDFDDLQDGEELIGPRICYKEIKTGGYTYIKKIYEYSMKSDPNKLDSEGDGIGDKLDNRPFIKGYYSEKVGDVVIGELTIVSSKYNSALLGHSYLVYTSHTNDTLDFTGLSGGYLLEINNMEYAFVEAGEHNLIVGESVSLGNTMKSIDGKVEIAEFHVDNDDVGVLYNREFALELENYSGTNTPQYYKDNRAYSMLISEEQLDRCINEHVRLDYYDLLWNNCVSVAGRAWNAAFGSKEFIVENLPMYLYRTIDKKVGSYEFDNLEAMGLR